MTLSAPELPSNRRFGFFFSIVFFILACFLIVNNFILYAILSLCLSILILIISFFFQDSLLPFNKLWMKFGLLLGKIVSPIIIGIIFFILITPTALIVRLFGRDELNLKKSKLKTFWIKKNESDSKITTFTKQF